MNRRSLLAAMLAACTAPAYVKAGILMPVRQIITPPALSIADIRRIAHEMHDRWMTKVWTEAFDRAYAGAVIEGFGGIQILRSEAEVQAVLARDVAKGCGIITIDHAA